MEVGSIKRNYILNLLNTLSGLLFPLITYPYVSRILLPAGIGEVRFFDSIIGYILLITSLGIPLYAIREIARVRHNHKEKSKTALEILSLHIILTIIAYIIVFIISLSVSKVQENLPLFYILSCSLLFTAIGANWFFYGTEDFKYITIRSLIIKVLMVIALFTIVKDKEDILWYAAIITMASVGNNIFNFFRLHKLITYKDIKIKDLNIKRHIYPSLKIFTLNMITSIYILLDTVMLGFISTESSVGYYATSSQLTRMSLGIVTAMGSVLMPRFSNYINTGRKEEFKQMGNKAVNFTSALVFPMFIGLLLMANPIVLLFSGENYAPAITTLQIISPLIIFNGFSSMLGMQMLYPQGKENIVILATLIGASANLILNFLLIPIYSQNGAAVSSVVAEFTVALMLFILGRKYLPFKFLSIQNISYAVGAILMGVVVYYIRCTNLETWLKVIIGVPSGVIIYSLWLLITKDPFVNIIRNFIQKNQLS